MKTELLKIDEKLYYCNGYCLDCGAKFRHIGQRQELSKPLPTLCPHCKSAHVSYGFIWRYRKFNSNRKA